MFLYSVGVQFFETLNTRLKEERLPKPDCRATWVIVKFGSISKRSASSIRFCIKYS